MLSCRHRLFPKSPESGWLGNAVRGCTRLLLAHRPYLLENELPEFTKPERYGYLFNYQRKEDALARAEESRDAFLPLFATLTFIVALYKHASYEYIDSSTPEWYRFLLQNGVSCSWLEDLQNSQILDFDCRKVGVILDFTAVAKKRWWAKYLDVYIKAGVPVYINWGVDLDAVAFFNDYKEFRPSSLEFMDAVDNYRKWRKEYMDMRNPRSALFQETGKICFGHRRSLYA